MLYLTRHGETVWHAEDRYAGATDIALNDRGRRQAELLAAWAKEAGLRALWCSDLRRARDTAAPVALATGLVARVDPRLRELDFGASEGLTMPEMDQVDPGRTAAFVADPVAGHMPGGEHPDAAAERGLAALADIAAGELPVLVVAHSTLLRLVLCRLLGIPLREYRTAFPRMRNCGITQLALNGDRVELHAFNAPVDGRW